MPYMPQSTPIPPDQTRIMPPEGLAPVGNPDAAIPGDQQSPTTMVLKYLAQRGYQPTSDNVRRALLANEKDPGVIPGLVNMSAPTDEDDYAAGAPRPGAGGGGGGRPLPVPPIPPQQYGPNEADGPPMPSSGGSGSGSFGQWLLDTLGVGAGVGAGVYAGHRMFGGKGASAGGSPDTSAPPIALPAPEQQKLLEGPLKQIEGPRTALPAPPLQLGGPSDTRVNTGLPDPNVAIPQGSSLSPLDTAMEKAVAPRGGLPEITVRPQADQLPMPPRNPGSGQGQLPMDIPRAAAPPPRVRVRARGVRVP